MVSFLSHAYLTSFLQAIVKDTKTNENNIKANTSIHLKVHSLIPILPGIPLLSSLFLRFAGVHCQALGLIRFLFVSPCSPTLA